MTMTSSRQRRLFRKKHSSSSSSLSSSSSSSTSEIPRKWKGYFRCDDLVPPLCDDDLKVTQHEIETIKGITITYWRYTPSVLKQHKYPILVINGGPGLGHNFIKPSRNLACDGREVVMYDQAGTGASQLEGEYDGDIDAVVAKHYPELLTLDYYSHVEVPAILKHLQWPQYHILAESWGTQVALEFAAHHENVGVPSGLQSLLLNAPIADNHKFIQYQWDPVDGSVGTLPSYTLKQLQYFNQTQDFDNEEFQELENSVMDTFNARIGVAVDCWLETEAAGISSINYDRLTGQTDIFFPGPGVSLKGWTVLPDLHRLKDKVPLLLNHGQYDMVRPQLIADTADAVGGNAVECHLLPRAAHSILLDSPMEVFGYMRDFLQRVEEAKRAQQPFVTDGTACFQYYAKNLLANTQNAVLPSSSHTGSHVTNAVRNELSLTNMALALVACVAVAFIVGVRVGMKRNKRYTHGYEQINHADHQVLEQELEGHVL